MTQIKKLKTILAVALLSMGVVGASMADHSHGRDDRGHRDNRQSERHQDGRHNRHDRGRDSYSETRHYRNGAMIGIYERHQYGSPRRGDEYLSRLSRYDREAVRYFRRHPYARSFVWFDYRDRRHVYYRADYPVWLLRF